MKCVFCSRVVSCVAMGDEYGMYCMRYTETNIQPSSHYGILRKEAFITLEVMKNAEAKKQRNK